MPENEDEVRRIVTEGLRTLAPEMELREIMLGIAEVENEIARTIGEIVKGRFNVGKNSSVVAIGALRACLQSAIAIATANGADPVRMMGYMVAEMEGRRPTLN